MYRYKLYKKYFFSEAWEYIDSTYLRASMMKHLEGQHGGVLTGVATFSICGRCGGLGGDCGCTPVPGAERLPNERLLEQFLQKLAKKKVKLERDR